MTVNIVIKCTIKNLIITITKNYISPVLPGDFAKIPKKSGRVFYCAL